MHSMNTLCAFVIDDVLIVNVVSGGRVGPILVMQYCTGKMRNICLTTCSLFRQSRSHLIKIIPDFYKM